MVINTDDAGSVMDYDSVEALKQDLFEKFLTKRDNDPRDSNANPEVRHRELAYSFERIGLGIAHTKRRKDFRLAVRVQNTRLDAVQPLLDLITREARGEVDIDAVSDLIPYAPTLRYRPLQVGSSVAHHAFGAGTIGMFPWDQTRQRRVLLSNHHVLTNLGLGGLGSVVLQPGPSDRGSSSDAVGRLIDAVPIDPNQRNFVDAAIAEIDCSVQVGPNVIASRDGTFHLAIKRIGDVPHSKHWFHRKRRVVFKLGRTTGLTQGRVIAERVDRLNISYPGRDVRFDRSIEIAGFSPERPFSSPGDSGAIIADDEGNAFGLLFAGAKSFVHKDVTYANELVSVFLALRLPLDIA